MSPTKAFGQKYCTGLWAVMKDSEVNYSGALSQVTESFIALQADFHGIRMFGKWEQSAFDSDGCLKRNVNHRILEWVT